MIRCMPTLGEHMVSRREQLAMSQNKAAKLFGGSRTTWINWEKDVATPERYNYVRIETVLKWEPGSVDAISRGEDPMPVRDHGPPAVPPKPESVPIPLEDWMALTPGERNVLARIFTGVRRRQDQQRRA